MNLNWQTIVALTIVAIAVAGVLRHFLGKRNKSCGSSCSSCKPPTHGSSKAR